MASASSQQLPLPLLLLPSTHSNTRRPRPSSLPFPLLLDEERGRGRAGCLLLSKAKKRNQEEAESSTRSKKQEEEEEEEGIIEEEEEVPWIEEKTMKLVEFSGSITQALPGPRLRLGHSSLPCLLALPLAYAGITFLIAFLNTLRKFNSPTHKRRKLVNKNAMLCKSIDDLFQKGRNEVQHSTLKDLMHQTGFDMEEIFRKYIRYAMNEKPFNPDMVADLIQFRKSSMLEDAQVAEILNDISRRIVRDKGPVVMDMSAYSEKGFKRKLAVQALFGKIFYLSELPEFCSKDSSLIIKDIFGVTDEDAATLRAHTLSESGDVDSLDKMLGSSDSEQADDESSVTS
ncbi:hypothetical protein Sjap_014430 [Stephania japonica]|uniref:Armadillo-like repeats domain-containing protein n=1 Tax=Stephania japonica TaxID=461633 RepID=A0AAP0IHC3_9MAGN